MHRSNLALFLISSWVYMGLAHVVQKCSEIMHRREFRDLPLPDRIAFFQTIKTMKNAPSEMDQANRFEDFTFIHWHNQHHAHKTPHFFPWHRHFLFVFENDLKRFSGNSSMTLPFFDWTLDAHQLEKSALLQPDTFGTSGDSKSRCLVDGQFARWNRTIPNSSCVKRSGRPILPELHSSKQISALIETITDYNEFWKVMELGPHNKFHQVIGGDFDTMFSTNDPLFFLHHAQLDRFWYEWQMKDPETRFSSFESLDDSLEPFGIKIQQAMDPRKLCYTYSAATQGSSSPTSTVSKSEGRRYLDLINGVSDGGVPNEQVQPFSDQWIEAHGLDREEVRQVEAEINNIFTSKVNLIDKPSKKPTKDDWESPFFEKK